MSNEQGDWLQLTEEDLERAQRLAREQPPMPGVIQITADEVKEAEVEVIHIEIEPEPPAVTADAPPESSPSPRTVETEPAETPQPRVARSGSRRGADTPRVYTAAPLTITSDDLTPTGPQTARSERVRELEELLFRLVNEARAQHLPSWLRNRRLQWHDPLAAVARGHSVDMIKRHFVEHLTPEGANASARLNAYGVRFFACGENIGVVYGENSHIIQGAHDIHNAFMDQPRGLSNHRGNILNPIWTHVGIGVAYNPDGALVVTQNFISAPAGLADTPQTA